MMEYIFKKENNKRNRKFNCNECFKYGNRC